MEEKYLKIPDEQTDDGYVELHYRDIGRGYLPIVFVHGLGADLVEFEHQMEFFASRHRCVAFDHRGFGLSNLEGEVGIDRSVKDLEFLVDSLGLDRFILCGHSMGTMVSYDFALRHPERVDKLVIVGGAASIKESPFTYIGLLCLPHLSPYMYESHRRWIVRNLALNISMFSALASPTIIEHYAGRNPRMYTGAFYEACLRYAKSLTETDFRPRLPEIDCPVLIIHGAMDLSLSVNAAFSAHRLLPNSEMHIIATCGHSPNIEHPWRVSKWMQEFIARADN